MTDHFAELEQSRRPWLDVEQLKERYHALTRSTASDPDRIGALTEAFRVLKDPRLRLQHFLQLEGVRIPPSGAIDEKLADVFMQASEVSHAADRHLLRATTTTNTLAKSLLQDEFQAQYARVREILESLRSQRETNLDRLRIASDSWAQDRQSSEMQLVDIYHQLSFLGRWIEQLEAKELELSLLH